MKKIIVLMCIVLMETGAFAYTLIGPPTAELEKTKKRHEDRHGYIFSFTEMDIGLKDVGTLEDFELTRHYYTWGIALDENFNFNILLGAASGQVDSEISEISDFDGNNGFSFGFNLKNTFHRSEKFDLGATVQMTWFSTEDTMDVDIPDFWTGRADVEADTVYNLQVAVGPTVDMGGWDLYGGAFYTLLDGDLDITVEGEGSASIGLDEEDEFGGFVGAQFLFNNNIDLIIEYIQGNNSYGIAGSVGIRF